MTDSNHIVFPFVRVVGQTEMKKALLLNAVDPGIGGVLIKGNKGTAKSTTVRSMPQFLPPHRVVKGCRFGCDPEQPRKMCPECREKYANKSKIEAVEAPTTVVELP